MSDTQYEDANRDVGVPKQPSGIDGFDQISYGGLPRGRVTLITGTPGSAKTTFSLHFLSAGIRAFDQAGVYVTFEERPTDLRDNAIGFGFEIAEHEEAGRWVFVDASYDANPDVVTSGDFDLGALVSRIDHAIDQIGAQRVVLDGVTALFGHLPDPRRVRGELHRLMNRLRERELTAIVTAERGADEGELSRYGIEELLADNVIVLRNRHDEEQRRRTIELLKYRGAPHQKGEFPFSVMPGQGIVIIPLSAIRLVQSSTEVRISSGVDELDEMCGGGFYRDAIILVSGATGTGKTLTTSHFVSATPGDERALMFAFEESRPQLIRNAKGWGMDFERMEQEGRLRIVANYPEVAGLEEHLILIKDEIESYQPTRLAIDSLSALERIGTVRGFREFVLGLTSFVKQHQIAGLFTSTTRNLLGNPSVTDAHISTITDHIILLRYVETAGRMRRGLTVLKMRGSAHDKRIREYVVDDRGLQLGQPFRNVTGVVAGAPRQQLLPGNQADEFANDEGDAR